MTDVAVHLVQPGVPVPGICGWRVSSAMGCDAHAPRAARAFESRETSWSSRFSVPRRDVRGSIAAAPEPPLPRHASGVAAYHARWLS